MEPDLIVTNGRIRTLDARSSEAAGLAVKDGRIIAVGEVAHLAGPATEVVDLGGRTVLPGIHDGHMHLAMWAANRPELSLDLAEVTSVTDIVEAVAGRVGEKAAGEWVKGHGWYEARIAELADRHPTRTELDAVSPDNPVVLVHFSEHAVWANGAALAAAGIDRDTPDPEGGTIVRDADGEPTGYLIESAGDRMMAILPEPTVRSYGSH